jgi:hypothetical protein
MALCFGAPDSVPAGNVLEIKSIVSFFKTFPVTLETR